MRIIFCSAPFQGQWLAHSIYLSICQWMNAWEWFLKDRALGTDSVHGLEAYLAMTNQFWKQVGLHLCYWAHSKSLLDQRGHSILWTGWKAQWGLEMSEDPNTTVVTPTATQWEWPTGRAQLLLAESDMQRGMCPQWWEVRDQEAILHRAQGTDAVTLRNPTVTRFPVLPLTHSDDEETIPWVSW